MVEEKNNAISKTLDNIQKYAMNVSNLKIDILTYEWEAFCDVLYEYAVMKKMEERYYEILNTVVENAIIKKLYTPSNRFPIYLLTKNNVKRFYTNNSFTLDNLLNLLWSLHSFKFKNGEIGEIKEEIIYRCSLGEVTDIKSLVKN